jgi:hypothetical protein
MVLYLIITPNTKHINILITFKPPLCSTSKKQDFYLGQLNFIPVLTVHILSTRWQHIIFMLVYNYQPFSNYFLTDLCIDISPVTTYGTLIPSSNSFLYTQK